MLKILVMLPPLSLDQSLWNFAGFLCYENRTCSTALTSEEIRPYEGRLMHPIIYLSMMQNNLGWFPSVIHILFLYVYLIIICLKLPLPVHLVSSGLLVFNGPFSSAGSSYYFTEWYLRFVYSDWRVHAFKYNHFPSSLYSL